MLDSNLIWDLNGPRCLCKSESSYEPSPQKISPGAYLWEGSPLWSPSEEGPSIQGFSSGLWKTSLCPENLFYHVSVFCFLPVKWRISVQQTFRKSFLSYEESSGVAKISKIPIPAKQVYTPIMYQLFWPFLTPKYYAKLHLMGNI